MQTPTPGRIVLYRTDGRNGLVYDLPAIITVTQESHPGDYPDGRANPLSVPESPTHVHLTVFTPGGFGTTLQGVDEPGNADYPDGRGMVPGSGTYVEHNVPLQPEGEETRPRSWRWPVLLSS